MVDHIAFLATEPERMAERFATLGLPVRKRFFPQARLYQMFVQDPDGLTIELNFHGIEAEPAWGGDSVNIDSLPRVGGT